MLDLRLPILDIRSTEAFERLHLEGSVNIPWALLPERLNLLPPKGTTLQLIFEKNNQEAVTFLADKGHPISAHFSWEEIAKFCEKMPEFPVLLPKLVSGKTQPTLWQPNPLLKQCLQEVLPHQRPLKILDLGCGGGREAVYAALQGHQVSAIEHKPQVIQRAKALAEHYGVKVDFRCCDLTQTACLPKEPFDLIMGFRFLERSLFPRLDALLKPHGWLMWQTFCEGVEAFGSPKNPKFILKKGELSQQFPSYKIVIDRIDKIEDGRPVISWLAQKTEETP